MIVLICDGSDVKDRHRRYAVIGSSVELSPVNGGWLVVKDPILDGDQEPQQSISIPFPRVKKVYST